jgi:hypothetical protein
LGSLKKDDTLFTYNTLPTKSRRAFFIVPNFFGRKENIFLQKPLNKLNNVQTV